MDRENIRLDISGSDVLNEGLLLTHVLVEKDDGQSFNAAVEWPFRSDGSAFFDQWFCELNKPPKDIGEQIYTEIFSKEFQEALDKILEPTRSAEDVWFKIRVIDDPLLSRIPFEIIHDGENYLLSENRNIIRYVIDDVDIKPKYKNLEKYLFILAEPTDLDPWGHDHFINVIQDEMKDSDIEYQVLEHAQIDQVSECLLSESESSIPYDAIIIIAHGSPATEDQDGYLFLEKPDGKYDKYSSSSFASHLSTNGHHGCFVYLGSCSTAYVTPSYPAASVGHRLMYNGPAGSVIAMQRPVDVDHALELIISFINNIDNNNLDIYEAYKMSITKFSASPHHGVPCMYSRPVPYNEDSEHFLMADSDFEKVYTSTKAVFSIDTEKTILALIFPEFIHGYKKAEFQKRVDEGKINTNDDVFMYSGPTTAVTDLGASKGILALLGKVFSPEEIEERIIIATDDDYQELFEDEKITNFILFGTESHLEIRGKLEHYSNDFIFTASDDEWKIVDNRTGEEYIAPDPSQSDQTQPSETDYAILEKAIDHDTGRVFIFIAGLWDTSTLGAGKFLLANIDEIYKKFGNGGFQYVLSFPPEKPTQAEIEVERRPKLSDT